MASRHRGNDGVGTRTSIVSLWRPGGEGTLSDLLTLPPPLFLALKVLAYLTRFWFFFAVLGLSYLMVGLQPHPFLLALLVLTAYLLRFSIKTAILYWRNPNTPIIARRR